MELNFTPIKQVYYNDKNGYRILGCVPLEYPDWLELNKYNNFTISGTGLENVKLNVPVCFDITPNPSSTYPASYTVSGFGGIKVTQDEVVIDPSSEIMLLQQIVSSSQAKYVNDACPNFCYLVLNDRTDEIDYKSIYNVAEYRFNDYCEKVKSHFKSFLFLNTTKNYNITDFGLVSKFAGAYDTPEIWEGEYTKHPYEMLSRITNWKFKQIDKLVLSALPDFETSHERARYCVYNYLEQSEADGDTRVLANIIYDMIEEEYADLAKFVYNLIDSDEEIYYDSDSGYCSLYSTYEAEKTIYDNIKQRVKNPYIDEMNWQDYKTADGYEMTAEQNEICRIANDKSIGMLVGPAGSGKTTSTKALLNMLDDYGKSYILLAPTGIASKRIRESTGRSAFTIHMALASRKFKADVYDFVIIDEMSCVGVELLAQVFRYVPNTTKFIFICDAAQLASISCGNIVNDIIVNNAIPIVSLSKIFRYGTSGIATIATNTRNGNISGRDDEYPDGDYKFVDIDADNPLEQVVDSYNELLLDGYKPSDILVLCPYNKSSIGTYTINAAIQKRYNTNDTFVIYEHGQQEITFKVGDRVINTQNNYNAIKLDINPETGEYEPFGTAPIMNGDIGVIRNISFEQVDGKYNIDVQFDDCYIRFPNTGVKHLLLGYAISVHKSQGSQAKAIISVISKRHRNLVTRNLLYVAVSRAQEKLIEIADKDCISNGLEIVETVDRSTWLEDWLAVVK